MMKVLVTGGCGFIGANLVPRLAAAGYQVRVLDNEILGRRDHLDNFAGEFIHGDIRDPAALDVALEGVDAVVHLAADTRVIESIADPAFNFDVNVVGSFRLIEAMRAHGVRRLVNASTGGAIIGDAMPPVHEGMVPNPIAPYGATKLAVEGLCSAWSGSYGFSALSLRFANVYGPRSYHKGSVVAAFFRRIAERLPLIVHGDGEQVRDFVFVDDLCDGIMRGIEHERSGVLQLGSGVPVSVNALIAEMRQVVAPRTIEVEYRPARLGEIERTWCDVSRARAALGYSPDTSLAAGLAQTWAWFCARSGIE
ncbi:SDR family NAD(P)-dependent oxidoreductase [Novosphingobium sp.]|uniref:SDR family NAD(P)-dependent oxidoreductase n=1 Tax=Novosphingobium sp. TaxID=1874826 RepID=UPI001D3BB6C4|nr:SDR family NAD(P)-dependent oxidoreductase [Novosphingobium sp.]MBX9664033.1 SDR family NAD(P)-dependent oxidoreductase [Novosphingobium sp.]